MTPENLNVVHFKEKLEKELALLETELARVGKRNPANPDDWEPTAPQAEDTAEEGERAFGIETLGENSALEAELELELMKVRAALGRIEVGTYGICTVCKNPIETERLEAVPSAITCKAHRDNEGQD
jgi:RNA polymerase-binding transcription factor DksA